MYFISYNETNGVDLTFSNDDGNKVTSVVIIKRRRCKLSNLCCSTVIWLNKDLLCCAAEDVLSHCVEPYVSRTFSSTIITMCATKFPTKNYLFCSLFVYFVRFLQ
jgi:hypothetical protein